MKECAVELCILMCQFVAAELINVGWGKKETQFHGSVGKQAALQTSQPQVQNHGFISHPRFIWVTVYMGPQQRLS